MTVCAPRLGLDDTVAASLRWLGSEHSIMEVEQRDLIAALKSWKLFSGLGL